MEGSRWGDIHRSKTLAKQATALEAVAKLYESGALNERLIPTWESEEIESEEIAAEKGNLPNKYEVKLQQTILKSW